jgi:bifunctional non-homologous end joining protein LigD
LRLISRQGRNFSSWFPELAELPSDVASADALLDGEVIVGNGSIESFNILLRRARLRGRPTPNALPVSFVAFDLLWHDGADLTQQPLEERRTQLRALVTESGRLAVSRIYADGPALLSIAAAHGLEGVVGKDRRSAYEPGRRSRSWLKTKVPGAHLAHEWNGDGS